METCRIHITRTILTIGLLYSFVLPAISFAALDLPTNGQVIANDSSSFLISGTAVGSAGRWIVYAPNGDYICEDTIASPWNTYPMTGLKAACGSTATLGSGAYYMFLHDVSYSPGCRVNGSMAYCAATIGATTPICLNVGNPSACSSTPPPAPAPTPAPAPASFDPVRYGTINVVTVVINDNGGTKKIADFPLFINGLLVISGVTNSFPAPALVYRVTETEDSKYVRTFSGDCGLQGGIGLNPGDNKFCIVTNNDIGAPVVVPPVPPLIDVVKIPSPLSLPNGPGIVKYTYTLKNIGTVPVANITLVGDTCSPIIRASGDTNSDQKLGLKETWVHTCSTRLEKTHTNTVVTTGWANGLSAVDITSATVVVGVPIVPPLIHVTKIPSPFTLHAGGGMVTYTKIITNPGTVPLSNVHLTDDKCGPVKYLSGDMNTNLLLEPSETWLFNCKTYLTSTTINTVIAQGEANGLTAKDIAIATVIVATPRFPETGASVPYVPLLGLTSVPNHFTLPKGGGAVTYHYAVKSFLDEVALTDVHVVDDTCAPIVYIEGDDDDNGLLNANETWRYSCSTTLSTTTQSIATVTGAAGNLTTTQKAYTTVVVGSLNLPPLVSIINITKVAYPLSLPEEGGDIIFTYHVNNPGNVPLSDIVVTDDKCKGMSGKLGDKNNNERLDTNEVWIYRCKTHLSKTTTNTVHVTAWANGLQAVSDATLTVRVETIGTTSTPYFPETGATSYSNKSIWLISSAILVSLVTYFTFIFRRKY